ncbi:MAG: hypothetical protein ABI629_16360 [bacterium]
MADAEQLAAAAAWLGPVLIRTAAHGDVAIAFTPDDAIDARQYWPTATHFSAREILELGAAGELGNRSIFAVKRVFDSPIQVRPRVEEEPLA